MEQNRIQTLADVFILIGLLILGMAAFIAIGIFLALPFTNIPIQEVFDVMQNSNHPQFVLFMKILNVVSTFGAWVFSVIMFFKIKGYVFKNAISLNAPNPKTTYFYLLPAFFVLVLCSAFLLEINLKIKIPEFLASFNSETNKMVLKKMLQMNSIQDLFLNIIVIALAPAIFEEIFFRGTLQKLLVFLFKNHHVGIFVCSFLFALVHLNFEQIIPMIFLSMVFGYLAFYTNSIIPTIILHFLNNSFAVIMTYFSDKIELANQLSNDEFKPPLLMSLAAIALIVLWIIKLSKNHQSNQTINE